MRVVRKYILTMLVAMIATSAYSAIANDNDGAKSQKIISKNANGITFVVDEGLEPVDNKYWKILNQNLEDGEEAAVTFMQGFIRPNELNIVATSLADERNIMTFESQKDVFFSSMLRAYAKHLSFELSPDMIWLLISQGFARYVNAHPEELRDQLVSHEGKKELVVMLQGEQHNWVKMVDSFSDLIRQHTKGNIAQALMADFSTTTEAARIASGITLMESVKKYFNYRELLISCGFPSITLKGSAKDWQRVLDKTRQLKQYGLQKWIRELEPILAEFVKTAQGNPDQRFWQKMVCKSKVDRLKGGACSSEIPTALDGWILKLFPDKNGLTKKSMSHTANMPNDHVIVDFLSQESDGEKIIRETPMEIWSGFIGAEVDSTTKTLIPKIGWVVRKSSR